MNIYLKTTLADTSIIRSCIVVLYIVLNSQAIANACCLARGEPFLSGPTSHKVSVHVKILGLFFRSDPQIFPQISLSVPWNDYISQSQSIHMAKVRMHIGLVSYWS